MGLRGPQPLPANIHILRGNPSKKPASELSNSFQPDVEIPTCPKWCLPEAKREWKRITPELEKYGLVSLIDRTALTLYCQAWAEYVFHKTRLAADQKRCEEARMAAEDRGEEYDGGDGVMVKTPNGGFAYSHHWVCANRAEENVNKFLSSFGMSPSSRSRVAVNKRKVEETIEDKWKI